MIDRYWTGEYPSIGDLVKHREFDDYRYVTCVNKEGQIKLNNSALFFDLEGFTLIRRCELNRSYYSDTTDRDYSEVYPTSPRSSKSPTKTSTSSLKSCNMRPNPRPP